jgi:pyroglutamyl-peptidase
MTTRRAPVVLLTGFEPFGPYKANPSGEIARALDGATVGGARVRGLVLPVHGSEATATLARVLDTTDPLAIVQLGLAAGRTRIALERVAVNVMDYPLPDAEGAQPHDRPCAPGGPVGYWSRLPLDAIVAALATEGIPAYVSNSAGTYLCNQVMYWTLGRLAAGRAATLAGFLHLPLSASMVAASGTDEPSMDLALMRRGVEIALAVVVAAAAPGAAARRKRWPRMAARSAR